MAKTILHVIPEPQRGTRPILTHYGEGTVVIRGGQPGHDFVCGSCGAVLIASLAREHVSNVVLKCNACGQYNGTEAADA